MKILYLLFNQAGQGTYWRAYHLARCLVRRGHVLTLVVTSRKKRLGWEVKEQDGILQIETGDLLWGSLRSGWDPWNALLRILALRGREFDLVHAFESRPVVIFPALYLTGRQRKPLFMDWGDWFGRGGSVEERPDPIQRAVLRPVETYFENHYRTRAVGTTVINTVLRQRAIQLGVRPETIRVIRNGSDISRQPLERLQARRTLGLSGSGPFLGFVGGTYTQDARLMASAFNQVLEQAPGARLLLVGYFNRDIEQWVAKPEAVLRTGPVSSGEIYPYLSACDLCWLPLTDSGANRGRWPFKLNDYLTVGRPVVATAVGDLAEVIPQYGFGLVTSPDPACFAQASLELIQDEPRQEKMGKAARKAAEEIFNWERLSGELETFYKQMLLAGR
jgi:glycosyltransferase involved in cell wall biosynthesis